MNDNLIGKVFGELQIIERIKSDKYGHRKFKCRCSCGKTIDILFDNLKRGHTKSCGCKKGYMISKKKEKHGKTYTKLYKIWHNMKQRCFNKNNIRYKDYGARGIKVCDKWKDDFMNFYNWSMSNGYSEELTIDRINNNGNYEPNNCRWTTIKEQNNNKRNNHLLTYNKETHTITEWSRILSINYTCLRNRILKKYPQELIFYKGKIPQGVLREYGIK